MNYYDYLTMMRGKGADGTDAAANPADAARGAIAEAKRLARTGDAVARNAAAVADGAVAALDGRDGEGEAVNTARKPLRLRYHRDGSLCRAKSVETCPFEKLERMIDEADILDPNKVADAPAARKPKDDEEDGDGAEGGAAGREELHAALETEQEAKTAEEHDWEGRRAKYGRYGAKVLDFMHLMDLIDSEKVPEPDKRNAVTLAKKLRKALVFKVPSRVKTYQAMNAILDDFIEDARKVKEEMGGRGGGGVGNGADGGDGDAERAARFNAATRNCVLVKKALDGASLFSLGGQFFVKIPGLLVEERTNRADADTSFYTGPQALTAEEDRKVRDDMLAKSMELSKML